MAYEVKLEKVIQKPASELFQAIKEGRLFMNCSASARTMKIDFRVGGKYHIDFNNFKKSNFGEFLEIIPDKKIVFSWCQSFEDQKPDTRVTIELFEDGSKTRLVLSHTGFKNQEICDGHFKGWTTGITDLFNEMENGRLRFFRGFTESVEDLYAKCKDELKGDVLEVVANKKITLVQQGNRITINFVAKENGESSLELIHDGLKTHDEQLDQRRKWEAIFEKMMNA